MEVGAVSAMGVRARVARRLDYYRRTFAAYVVRRPSQLGFWHEVPELNERAEPGRLGEYYMAFRAKADYAGPYDAAGVPLLNYRGAIGCQYNPIAIAQYGLGNYNRFRQGGWAERRRRFTAAADWLVNHLERNAYGQWVWNHHFDWEYRTPLKAPWYSGLAQGQGISLLVRAYQETQDPRYLQAAHRAFEPFLRTVDRGGVTYIDASGHKWFEEYIVDPPTHILNGFIWASWGVYDYSLATKEVQAQELFSEAVRTLIANLQRYDVGFWSLYEQSSLKVRMLASSFYHNLHITQLELMYRLTGKKAFREFADRWEGYRRDRVKRMRALLEKACFKLIYY